MTDNGKKGSISFASLLPDKQYLKDDAPEGDGKEYELRNFDDLTSEEVAAFTEFGQEVLRLSRASTAASEDSSQDFDALATMTGYEKCFDGQLKIIMPDWPKERYKTATPGHKRLIIERWQESEDVESRLEASRKSGSKRGRSKSGSKKAVR